MAELQRGSGAHGLHGGRLRWGHCERVCPNHPGSRPDRNCVGIGVGVGIAIGYGHRLTCRRAHVHPCRDRPVDRAARSVGDVEEYPLGVSARDTLARVAVL